MTAEISVLNKSGVALAADSAVTIGQSKVYNSVNKLFSLSKIHPVGIMIYGGANFMGTPWETIIKSYRDKIGSKEMDYLEEYKDDFLDFLLNDKRLKNKYQEKVIVHNTFKRIIKIIINEVQEFIEDNIKEGNVPGEQEVEQKLNIKLNEYIDKIKDEHEEIMNFKKLDFYDCFEKVIEGIVNDNIYFTYTKHTKELMMNLAYEVVRRDVFSRSKSGIVISGYGKNELFPSQYELLIDGFILNELKFRLKSKCEISNSPSEDTTSAAVIPFAQKEMVYSFMNGIDPILERNIHGLITSIFSDYADLLNDKTSIKLSEDDVKEIDELGIKIRKSLITTIQSFQQKEYVSPVIDIVEFLPKEELAEMAEALVNLTSFKRRVSIDTETVGGPIDVAVITKGDGFIWIKRKHYFKPELNHSFFHNYQRSEKDVDDADL